MERRQGVEHILYIIVQLTCNVQSIFIIDTIGVKLKMIISAVGTRTADSPAVVTLRLPVPSVEHRRQQYRLTDRRSYIGTPTKLIAYVRSGGGTDGRTHSLSL